MSLIIPDGFAQVCIPLLHVGQSREACITFGVEAAAIDWGSELNAIFVTWQENLGIFVDEGVVQGPARATVGTPSGEGLSVEGTTTYVNSGTAAKVPSNVALLIRKLTSRGGRRGRGRMYVPWILNEGSVDDVGNIDGTYRGTLQAAAIQWMADLAEAAPGGPFAPMVLLHSSGGSTAPGSPNEVTDLVVDPLVATQRRRLRS